MPCSWPRVWYSQNFLKSNDAKTDIIILFSKFCSTFYKFPIAVGDILINPSIKITNLGVTIDQNMTMTNHINNVVSTAFLKLRELYFYRRYLTKESLIVLVHAFITSRVDYCNSLFTGLPNVLLRKLQSIHSFLFISTWWMGWGFSCLASLRDLRVTGCLAVA